MAVKLHSRFATADETAQVLGVSSKRVKEIKKLIDESIKSRRDSGIPWIAPAASRNALIEAHFHHAKKSGKFTKTLSTRSRRTRTSKKSSTPRRTQKRGKKTKTAR